MGGADKAFLRLHGIRLIDRLLARLGPGPIAISTNGDPARFAEYGVPVLPDGRYAGKGPLAGVAAGLEWAASIAAEAVLTVPVDTPFIPVDLAMRLGPAPAVAVWRGRQHHLVAHWPITVLPALAAFLAAPGDYKVRDALALIEARQVSFDDAEDPFLNINLPEDLARAEQRSAAL
jgi:molybdopterin-guanine dinucleotide biosynthesis protein A